MPSQIFTRDPKWQWSTHAFVCYRPLSSSILILQSFFDLSLKSHRSTSVSSDTASPGSRVYLPTAYAQQPSVHLQLSLVTVACIQEVLITVMRRYNDLKFLSIHRQFPKKLFIPKWFNTFNFIMLMKFLIIWNVPFMSLLLFLCPRRVTAAVVWATTRHRCRPRPAPARRSSASTSLRPQTHQHLSANSQNAAPTSSLWVLLQAERRVSLQVHWKKICRALTHCLASASVDQLK